MKVRMSVAVLLVLFLAMPKVSLGEVPPGRTWFGLRFGEEMAEGFVDLMAPLAGGDVNSLFLDARLSLGDESENELNIGAGYRQLVGGWAILGGNVYFDTRKTRHGNRFDQVGAGLELLSTWVDARGNYYWPQDDAQLAGSYQTTSEDVEQSSYLEYGTWGDPYAIEHDIRQDRAVSLMLETTITTTDRTFQNWESAREGYDAEVGFRLPIFDASGLSPAVRVFVGYYDYEDDFDRRVSGPKGRLEVRAWSWLTLNAEVYDDEELNGSRYTVGAWLDAPFNLSALFDGGNPFVMPEEGAGVAARMDEMVMRDGRVQTSESGWAENEALRQVNQESQVEEEDRFTEQYTLLTDVTFVDGDNPNDPLADGTAEHPYDTIQDGADNIFGLNNLYVFGAATAYQGGVVLQQNTTLIGSGTALLGMGGKTFGGDEWPVINGAIIPAPIPGQPVPPDGYTWGVSLANDTTVTGIDIQGFDFGIWGDTLSGDISVYNNRFTDNMVGVLVATGGDATVNLSQNTFCISDAAGSDLLAGIVLANLGGTLTGTIAGNTVGSWSDGEVSAGYYLGIGVANLGLSFGNVDVALNMSGLEAPLSASLEPLAGRGIVADGAAISTDVTISGNDIAGTLLGIGVANLGTADMTASVSGNTVADSYAGIVGLNAGLPYFGVAEPGTLTLGVSGNTVAVTGVDGYGAVGIGLAGAGLATTTAIVANNYVEGYEIGIGAINISEFLGFDGGNVGIIPIQEIVLGDPGLTHMNLTISGNTIYDTFLGVGVSTIGNPLTDVTISDNCIDDAFTGVDVVASSTVDDFNWYSWFTLPEFDVTDQGGSTTVTIGGNSITNADVGIWAGATGWSTLDMTVSGNTLDVGDGVILQAADFAESFLDMSGNTITSVYDGLYLYTESLGHLQADVSDNTLNAGQEAIYAETWDDSWQELDFLGNTGTSPLTITLDNNASMDVYGYGTLVTDNADAAGSPAVVNETGTLPVNGLPRP